MEAPSRDHRRGWYRSRSFLRKRENRDWADLPTERACGIGDWLHHLRSSRTRESASESDLDTMSCLDFSRRCCRRGRPKLESPESSGVQFVSRTLGRLSQYP